MSQDRKRSIDISKLTFEEADNLSAQIGAKVNEIAHEASNKINALLKIYGMSADFYFTVNPAEQPKGEEKQS